MFAVFRKLGELGKRWNEVLPYTLDFYNTVDDNKKGEVAQKIRDYYGIEEDITVKNVSGLTKVLQTFSVIVVSKFLLSVIFRSLLLRGCRKSNSSTHKNLQISSVLLQIFLCVKTGEHVWKFTSSLRYYNRRCFSYKNPHFFQAYNIPMTAKSCSESWAHPMNYQKPTNKPRKY